MATTSTIPSMESSSCGVVNKPNSNDVGWNYGKLVDPNNKDITKCDLCLKVQHGGVNRLKHHIAGIQGNCVPCPNSTKEDKLICRNAIMNHQLKQKEKKEKQQLLRKEVNIDRSEILHDPMEDEFGGSKATNTFGPMDKFASVIPEEVQSTELGKRKHKDQENIFKERLIRVKQYICRWAYECAIPFHAFEKDSCKMMLEAVGRYGPNAPPPTRYELGETYLKKEVERTRSLLKRFEEEWKLNGCSIMTDAWSDRKRRSIMNLCVNSKLGTVFLSSKECSNQAHTSLLIFEYVEGCIVEVGPENVVQIVTDNAANNMGAAKLLKETRPTIFWTSCAAHTINLMLEGIGNIPRYKKILEQAKKLTVFIYAHHKTLALMRHFTNKRDIVRPGVTRFASAYLTLQSLNEKKSQLRQMFGSDDWDSCKLSKTIKGKASYETVVSTVFWSGVTTFLKVFSPLVKVLRMVDADWKPSMGFLYGELKNAKEEIKQACSNNTKSYEPIMDIIEKKMKDRLDSSLHLAAYLLNPFYLYNDSKIQDDVVAAKGLVKVVETLYPEDYDIHTLILTKELPIYKGKLEDFSKMVAIKGCQVNDDNYDPANWWSICGLSTPCLRKIAMKLLSLTTSSSGCERNWSTFEGVHTKKRNRLEATKLNNLVYVQFNANLMERSLKRKARGHEVLLAHDASEAQDWIVDGAYADEVEPGLPWDAVSGAMGADEYSDPQRSETSRERELFEDDFDSDSEEEIEDDDVEYESDGVQIIEQYGQDVEEA